VLVELAAVAADDELDLNQKLIQIIAILAAAAPAAPDE
jgi:hypothetical protein